MNLNNESMCVICNSGDETQTHHLSYTPEITIQTCVKCHTKIHGHGVGREPGFKQQITVEKVRTTIYISKDVIDASKKKGINISDRVPKVINKYFEIYPESIIELRRKEEKILIELAALQVVKEAH